MALEIAGARVRQFGVVWGSLIGIFLGAMSDGYWLGCWLSDALAKAGAAEHPARRHSAD